MARRLIFSIIFFSLVLAIQAYFTSRTLYESYLGPMELGDGSVYSLYDSNNDGAYRRLSRSDVSLLEASLGGVTVLSYKTHTTNNVSLDDKNFTASVATVSDQLFSDAVIGAVVVNDIEIRRGDSGWALVSQQLLKRLGVEKDQVLGAEVSFSDQDRFIVSGILSNRDSLPVTQTADIWISSEARAYFDSKLIQELPDWVRGSVDNVRPNWRVLAIDHLRRDPSEIASALNSLQNERQHLVTWEDDSGKTQTIGFRTGKQAIVALPGVIEDGETLETMRSIVGWTFLVGVFFLFAASVAFVYLVVDESYRRRAEFGMLASLGASDMRLASVVLKPIGAMTLLSLIFALVAAYVLESVVSEQISMTVRGEIFRNWIFSLLVVGTTIVFATLVAAWLFLNPKSATKLVVSEDDLSQSSRRSRMVVGAAQVILMNVSFLAASLVVVDLYQYRTLPWGIATNGRYLVELEQTKAWDFQISGLEFLSRIDGAVNADGSSAVALVGQLPPFSEPVRVDAFVADEYGRSVTAIEVQGSTGFFEVAGIAPLVGDTFSTARQYGAVISEELAIALYGTAEDALNARIEIGTPRENSRMPIIGVVPGLRNHDSVFFRNTDLPNGGQIWTNRLLIKSDQPAVDIRHKLQSATESHGYVPRNVQSVPDRLRERERPFWNVFVLLLFVAISMTIFAFVTTMAYIASDVARRSRELALRVAIGASATRMAMSISKEVLVFAAAGLAVGTALGLQLFDGFKSWSLVLDDRSFLGVVLTVSALSGILFACLTIVVSLYKVHEIERKVWDHLS